MRAFEGTLRGLQSPDMCVLKRCQTEEAFRVGAFMLRDARPSRRDVTRYGSFRFHERHYIETPNAAPPANGPLTPLEWWLLIPARSAMETMILFGRAAAALPPRGEEP